MKLRYVGQIESLEIVREGIVVERGGIIDVKDSIGLSLLQSGNFKEVFEDKQIVPRDIKPVRKYQKKGV